MFSKVANEEALDVRLGVYKEQEFPAVHCSVYAVVYEERVKLETPRSER